VESDLIDIHVDLLDVKMSMALRKANDRYLRNITNTVMDQTSLNNIYKGDIGEFDALAPNIKNKLRRVNKYITRTKISDGDGNVLSTIDEYFVSGDITTVNSKFAGSVPNWITNPPDQDLFDIFTLKAIDRTHPNNIARNNDTELKYIFNFLEQHWNSGTRFEITAASTLYTCTSCQGYLIYLQKLAEKYNKSIVFEVISDPRATTISKTKKLIN
jgi:thiol-disulfide isomerase/thioredoxin